MKILYHHRTLGDGAEGIHIREMVKAFRELGHEVKVVGPVGEVSPDRSKKSRILEKIKLSIPHSLYELFEIAYSGVSFWKISREIRTFKPDLIYDRYITFNAGSVFASRIYHVPLCLEVNAPLAKERSTEEDERLVFQQIGFFMEKWVCASATRTIVVSTPLKHYLESIGVPHNKCIVMPNGVDPNRFSPREKDTDLLNTIGIDKDYFVIGFTGVLRPWHGIDLLLHAFAGLVKQGRKTFLLIVGDGPYRISVERIASELGVENRILITGRIAHDSVPKYVSLFDIAVSPRATFYASPMKVIEYMALGKPVLVPRTPNFLDIIDEGINGMAFEDGNATAMEKAIITLCESIELRKALGVHAREKVEKRLNWRWNAEEVCRLFSS